MAVTQNSYNGNGSTTQYSFTFPYLKSSEVKAQIDATVTTAFTLANATTVQFNTAPANGAKIKIYRETDTDSLAATFYAGSAIKSEDLNDNFTQNLHTTQEVNARYLSNLGGTMVGDMTMAEDVDIVFEGATDDAYETTLTVADPTADRVITLPNVTGTVVTTGDTGTVTSSMIADGTFVNADINASAAIAQSKLNIANATTSAAGYQSAADKTKLDGIETAATADQTAAEIRTLVESATDSNVFTDADHSKLNAIEASATADQTNAEIRAAVEAASDSNVFTDADHSKLNAIEASATADQTASEIKTLIASSPLDASHLAADSVTTSELADAELTTLAGMQSGTASILASGTALAATTTEINSICDGKTVQTTISDTDASYPTSGAVVDYVAAQIAPLGGLEVIANEDSFPTQPSSGVVISIADAGGIVVNGSGVSTTARTSGNGSDNVTINGFPSTLYSTTLTDNMGLLVSSTGSSNTYTYHKLLGKESDIKTLSDDINDFNARYRIASSAPSSNNDDGDLYFDTTSKKMKVYNAGTSQWDDVAQSSSSHIVTLSQSFNGSLTDFTMSTAATDAQSTIVSINGVIQKPNAGTSTPAEGFAISGNTLKLSNAPATGSTYFIVVLGDTVSIGTPSDNTVSTAKIQNLAVTTDKIAANAVTAAKIASGLQLGTIDAQNNTLLGSTAGDSFDGTNAEDNTLIGYAAGTAITTGDDNTAVGAEALDANTTGSYNTAIGMRTLSANTTADDNTALGRTALFANTTGARNTGLGRLCLSTNTTANDNTAVGYSALGVNTTGTQNVAVGTNSLDANTTANDNTAVGHEALTANTTGGKNAGFGHKSLKANTTGGSNTALGASSLRANTTASYITAIGAYALTANTTGERNTAVGYAALDANTTSNDNTAIGYNALTTADGADYCTAVGQGALALTTTGDHNTAIGFASMNANTTGEFNTAVGNYSLDGNTTGAYNCAFGYGALDSNTTASYNTGLGFKAGQVITTGALNTALGAQAMFATTTGGSNTAIGVNALMDNTTGINNIAIGVGALADNITGSHNIGIGVSALEAATGANYNTAIGWEASRQNTSGELNTATGYRALQDNTTGERGTAFGAYALNNNTTGDRNVAIGYNAMGNNTTGQYNTAVGAYALDAQNCDYNTAIGYFAMSNNTTGTYNTAIGDSTLYTNTTGSYNTAVGYQALTSATTGGNNVAMGYGTLDVLTTGSWNIAIGLGALDAATTSSHNTAVGSYALSNNTTGADNTAVGYYSLLDVTTGSYNTAMGRHSGEEITTGSYNVCLGYRAGDYGTVLTTGRRNVLIGSYANSSAAAAEYEIILGYNATGKGDHTFYVGNVGNGVYNSGNTTAWQTTSDERIKKNIVNNNTGLDILNQIQVRNFEYRTEDEIVDFDNPKAAVIEKEGQQLGVIAQELEKILPECVKTQSTGVKTVDSDNLTWYLINAVKELSAKVTALEAK